MKAFVVRCVGFASDEESSCKKRNSVNVHWYLNYIIAGLSSDCTMCERG